MFTTRRTQPGVPCRHLLLLPVALCGPSAGRIFALSGRLLGFLPVYFCVRFSLVFSLSAFGRRARFGPSGAIFFFCFFSGACLPACFRGAPVCPVLRGCGFRLPSRLPVFYFLSSFFRGSRFFVSFVFLVGFLSFISLVSLSVLFSALFHLFFWVLPFCGYFLIYFYFIFIFFYLSAYR